MIVINLLNHGECFINYYLFFAFTIDSQNNSSRMATRFISEMMPCHGRTLRNILRGYAFNELGGVFNEEISRD